MNLRSQQEGEPFADPQTGARVTRLTSYPVLNTLQYYGYGTGFTHDSRTVVFFSHKVPHRSAEYDVYRIDVDGHNTGQLTDYDQVGCVVTSPVDRWIYCMRGGECRRVHVDTGEDVPIGHVEGVAQSNGYGAMSPDGTAYYPEVFMRNGEKAILRFRTDGSESRVLYTSPHPFCATKIEPSEGKVLSISSGRDPLGRNVHLIDEDGTNLRVINIYDGNGHYNWLGPTKRILSGLKPHRWGIATVAEGEEREDLRYTGANFWHPSASYDGRFMVADTNWPDIGLQLISVKTARFRTLCLSGSSNGAPQWSHPHPLFSPDDRYVGFNSDMTGIPHVYVVEIPEEYKAELETPSP